jgi:hypothetical protein
MNINDQAFNRSPCHTDWRRYDPPTVLRRHGRGFLERFWEPDPLNQEHYALSRPELETLVESYGGLCLPSSDQTMLVFADYHWARRCQHLLGKRGVSSHRIGCHLHLQEPWQ